MLTARIDGVMLRCRDLPYRNVVRNLEIGLSFALGNQRIALSRNLEPAEAADDIDLHVLVSPRWFGVDASVSDTRLVTVWRRRPMTSDARLTTTGLAIAYVVVWLAIDDIVSMSQRVANQFVLGGSLPRAIDPRRVPPS